MSKFIHAKRVAAQDGREVRVHNLSDIAVRAASADDITIGFRGTAAVFGPVCRIGPPSYGFWEQVDAHFFDSAMGRDDVRMLKNHNTDLPLARSTTGSLRLDPTTVGLGVDADMDPTTYASDLAICLRSGTVSQMSFGFEVKSDSWTILDADQPWGGKEGDELRVMLDCAKLWEVSPVTFPAYVDTDAAARSHAFEEVRSHLFVTDDELAAVLRAVHSGEEVEPELVAAVADRLRHSAPLKPAIASTDTPVGSAVPTRSNRNRAKLLFP